MADRLTSDQLEHIERISLTPQRSVIMPTLQLRQLVHEHRGLKAALVEACNIAEDQAAMEPDPRIAELRTLAEGA